MGESSAAPLPRAEEHLESTLGETTHHDVAGRDTRKEGRTEKGSGRGEEGGREREGEGDMREKEREIEREIDREREERGEARKQQQPVDKKHTHTHTRAQAHPSTLVSLYPTSTPRTCFVCSATCRFSFLRLTFRALPWRKESASPSSGAYGGPRPTTFGSSRTEGPSPE